ncbi:hypothetical protein Landi51_13946, partial [Colletotrichum acutatum]
MRDQMQDRNRLALVSRDLCQVKQEVQGVESHWQDEINARLSTVEGNVKTLKRGTEAGHERTKSLSQDLSHAKLDVERSFQSQTSALEALSRQTHDRMQQLKNETAHSTSAVDELQVRCRDLEISIKGMVDKVLTYTSLPVSSMHPGKKRNAEGCQLEQEKSDPGSQAECLNPRVEVRTHHEGQPEGRSQSSKVPRDSSVHASSRDRQSIAKAGATDAILGSEGCPSTSVRDQANSTGEPQNRNPKPVGVRVGEMTTSLENGGAAIETQADGLATGTTTMSQNPERQAESWTIKNEISDTASKTENARKRPSGHPPFDGVTYVPNKDDEILKQEYCRSRPVLDKWAIQKLEEKDVEITCVINYYEKQRSKHLRQCQAYFDETKAKVQ